MEELEWATIINGESEIDADDINKLAEYAKALNINKSDVSDVTTLLSEKVDKIDGKDLSTNDFTDADKEKVAKSVSADTLNDLIKPLESNLIKNNAKGEFVHLTDSTDERLKGLNIYGKTTQDGIPTPDTPIELNSIGNDGNVDVIIADEENNSQTLVVSTPNGLCGIPVSSGGNYTDSNGQQWVCDEVDFEKGVYIQRIGEVVFDGSSDEKWKYHTITAPNGFMSNQFYINFNCKHDTVEKLVKSTQYIAGNIGERGSKYGITYTHANGIAFNINPDITTDVSEWISILANNPVTCICVLTEPIETPLTEEQLTAYKSLHTYYPITNISNDEGAGMSVDYIADTKNYIDNKFAELQNAIISTGGNV